MQMRPRQATISRGEGEIRFARSTRSGWACVCETTNQPNPSSLIHPHSIPSPTSLPSIWSALVLGLGLSGLVIGHLPPHILHTLVSTFTLSSDHCAQPDITYTPAGTLTRPNNNQDIPSMPNTYSKMSVYKLVPSKYINRLNLELQRTFLVVLSLLKTHRRKAILLSMGPSTILKFITVMLPIFKLMPTVIKAARTLSHFTKSNNNNSGNNNSNRNNALANRDANNAAAAAGDGIGMSMDELNEILWTPAEDMYWERVNAMVTRFGLCKTLGITLAGVRPGRVEVVMPFRTEVSGEGGAFHGTE